MNAKEKNVLISTHRKKKIKKSIKTKFIVNESFCGKRKPQDIFSDIFISKYNNTTNFTREQRGDTMQIPTVKSNLCCSRKETL